MLLTIGLNLDKLKRPALKVTSPSVRGRFESYRSRESFAQNIQHFVYFREPGKRANFSIRSE